MIIQMLQIFVFQFMIFNITVSLFEVSFYFVSTKLYLSLDWKFNHYKYQSISLSKLTLCFALTSYLRWKRHVFQPAFVHLLNKRLFLEQKINIVTGCIEGALFIHRHCAHNLTWFILSILWSQMVEIHKRKDI